METKLSELTWWLQVLNSAMKEELAKKDRRSDDNVIGTKNETI